MLSEENKKDRIGVIGSSEADSIMAGGSRRERVVNDKVGQILYEEFTENPTSQAMRRGTNLQQQVIDYLNVTGNETFVKKEVDGVTVGATIDSEDGERIYEIKVPLTKNFPDDVDEYAQGYKWQCVQQEIVHGKPVTLAVALFDDNDVLVTVKLADMTANDEDKSALISAIRRVYEDINALAMGGQAYCGGVIETAETEPITDMTEEAVQKGLERRLAILDNVLKKDPASIALIASTQKKYVKEYDEAIKKKSDELKTVKGWIQPLREKLLKANEAITERVTSSDMKPKFTRKVEKKTVVITDASKIPDEYKIIDEAKIKRDGGCPGAEIEVSVEYTVISG